MQRIRSVSGACVSRSEMFCMYFSAHHARIGRGAGLGFSCKWHLQQRKLCQRQAITATGIQRENASLQRQGVEQFKKNLVIPTQLMGKVCAPFKYEPRLY
jgi:hypothetical protein